MQAGTIRSWSVALSVVAAMGLSHQGMATTTTPGTEAASEEENRSSGLEALSEALAQARAILKYIEEQLAALQEARAEADRKRLALSLPPGLSRSTESPLYSVEAGKDAIAAAEDAVAEAGAVPPRVEAYIAFLEAEIQRVETALEEVDCVPTCSLDDELTALRDNLGLARSDLAAAQDAAAAAEEALARQVANPGVLAGLLPDPGVRFAPLSATLGRDFDGSRVFRTDDAHVKAISSDGEGGFHVTYMIGRVEQEVHYAPSEYERGNFRKLDEEGETTTHLLWTYTNSFRRADANRNQGSTEFRYFDGHGSLVPGGYRSYMSYGARTHTDGLPAGTATYAGRMGGERWSRGDPVFASGRSNIRGNLNLTADFQHGTIEGRINRIYIDPPGANNAGLLPSSTHFDIEDGRIDDGQFTANLKGADMNANAATDDTVVGYEGGILGEFYGPAAEEMGGVLSAESETHNSVLSGWFGARQLRSIVPTDAASSPSSVGVERDYDASTVQLADDSAVTAISSDGEGGYDVTYKIDGVEYAVRLEGGEYGSFSPVPALYYERRGAEARVLYSGHSRFFGSTTFFGDSEYDHFDVLGWSITRYSGADTNTISYAPRGFLVHGVRTEADGLPAGEASYAGKMGGYIWETDKPDSSNSTLVRGALSLTADFDDSTVSGSIGGIETLAPGQTAYQTSTEVLTVSAGTITDRTFTADLTGTGAEDSRYEGDVDGQFFGPAADEVGGVLEATHTGNDNILIGWFGGKKDERAETTPVSPE